MNASWPQTKTIWGICVKVKSDAYAGLAVDSMFWKRLADNGRLNREDASNIIGAFIARDAVRFLTGIQKFDSGFTMSESKFKLARRWKPREKYIPKKKEPPLDPRRAFKKGDPVIFVHSRYLAAEKWLDGALGKVLDNLEANPRCSVGVEWNMPIRELSGGLSGGHSCGGECKDGHGWNVVATGLIHDDGPLDVEVKDEEEPEIKEPEPEGTEEDEFTKKLKELEAAHKKAAEAARRKKERESFKPESIEYVKPDIFDDVCMMIKGGVQVCLVGPSGCGKSLMISEIAKVLSRSFYVESFAGGKRYSQVFGSTHLVDGKSEWVPAKFLQELQKENIIVFMDEVMSADADVLIGANPILDRKTRAFHAPVGVITVSPTCTICAASNVTGREYSMNYKGTQQQDASVLNRFVHVHMGYDSKVEETIVKKAPIEDKDKKYLLDNLKNLRQKINANNIAYDPSTRKLVQAIELNVLGLPMSKAFEYAFLTPLSIVERKKLEL